MLTGAIFLHALIADIVGKITDVLYIEDGKYQSDGSHYSVPLSEDKRMSLIEQGVSEIFTRDS